MIERKHSLFTKFARWTACETGKPVTFISAAVIILIWIVTGPFFHFSDTWQLVINTGTTIITFLMVFLIQNTQNRDTEALQLKLDEIIRAIKEANNRVLNLEELDEDELDEIREEYLVLAKKAREEQDESEQKQGEVDH
ncbi:MAG: low affinity iron permease family protein [Acidobacteriota bacterium]|nr:low affinity iron permease family protein [Acidobacteriota bacterium]